MTDKAPNRSSAVMQQRKSGKKQAVDYYPTPPWATERLMHWLISKGHYLGDKWCHEPAAGGGHMVEVLEDNFQTVSAYDLHDPEGKGYKQHDFTIEDLPFMVYPDWIITNPPFVLAEEFAINAIRQSRLGCALICRIAFLEGKGRHERLFSKTPPTYVLPFVNRVAMVKGRYDPEARSATCYAWFVWLKHEHIFEKTLLEWLP